MRSRMLAVGLTAIVAGAVVGATPAFAQGEDADLGIEFTGTTIAEDVPSKFGTLTVTNESPAVATNAVITYDVSGLDTSKVTLDPPGCPLDGADTIDCFITDPIDPGANVVFGDLLNVVAGATGDAGEITVSIRHDGGDPNPANDSFTAPVAIGGSGPDLLVYAPDIRNEAEVNRDTFEFEVLDSPVLPGSDAVVYVFVQNQGNLTVSGVEMSIALPEHVTFTIAEEGDCTHAAGDSETTCTYEAPQFVPVTGTDPEEDCVDSGSCGWFVFPVEVSEDAPAGPLTDGVAEAYGIETVNDGPSIRSVPADPELPRTFTTEPGPPEVDPTDNVSGFTVFVSEEPGGSGGGDLPVTGVPAALLGVGGAAVLAIGVGLFLFTRKRRVVLQTPADGSTE